MMVFSDRTAWDVRPNNLTEAVQALREQGTALLDLTVSNPTACGFRYDEELILNPLRSSGSLVYDPDPRGLLSARQAVVRYYTEHEAQVSSEQIVLTTSTSEAYSFLFRLLCNPGEEILTAQPGYPLFDFLAALDDVVLSSYPLFYDFGWWIDLAELERRISSRTRAIVVVHPNNPTGHATRDAERRALEALCVRHNLALIVDEVFLDYPVAGPSRSDDSSPIRSFACGPHPCLTFVLSGISKICALPQMKAAWIATFGPASDCETAGNRLEVIADTFLSLNAPVQHALPVWLANQKVLSAPLRERVSQNLAILSAAVADGIEHLPVEAGWAAVLRLPANLHDGYDSGVAEVLLRRAQILVHPGSFYGLSGINLIVVSLIIPSATLREAFDRIAKLCTERRSLQANGY